MPGIQGKQTMDFSPIKPFWRGLLKTVANYFGNNRINQQVHSPSFKKIGNPAPGSRDLIYLYGG